MAFTLLETSMDDRTMKTSRAARRGRRLQRCRSPVNVWALVLTLVASPALTIAWSGGTHTSIQQVPWRANPSRTVPNKSSVIQLGASLGAEEDAHASSTTGVTLKIALDATGGAADLAEIKSERFTGPESLDMVHRLRRDSDAVLVGRGTVQADDCSLTVRRIPCEKQPLRVVIDPRLSLLLESVEEGKSYQLFEDGLQTAVYHSVRDVDESSLNLLETVTLVYLPAVKHDGIQSGEYVSVEAVVQDLADRFQVRHLMVEGGPATAKLFLEKRLVDRVVLVKAPLCFRKPLDAGITTGVLDKAGLELLGSVASGADEIECWSLSDKPWPTKDLGDWP